MSLFSMLKNVAKAKVAEHNAPPVAHTEMPLGLTQGAAVALGVAVSIAPSLPGAQMPTVKLNQTVVAVGRMTLFGLPVYRAYLNDNSSFIQVVMEGEEQGASIAEVHLFTNVSSSTPDQEGWDYLLNDRDGYIGLWDFGLGGGDKAVTYRRSWQPEGGQRVPPVVVRETVIDPQGLRSVIEHRLMQYERTVGSAVEVAMPEAYVAEPDSASPLATFNVFVGIPLDEGSINVYPAA